MQVKEIIQYLETLAPPVYQEGYDNSGLITGNSKWECSGALLCLDSTEIIVEEAIEKGCNLIIAHHPIVFSGLKKITGRNYVERTIIKAIKNDIAIYAIHTNLDNVHIGVNRKIADLLALQNCRILAPKKRILQKLTTYCSMDSVTPIQQALLDIIQKANEFEQASSFSELGVNVQQAENNKPETAMKISAVYPARLSSKMLGCLNNFHSANPFNYEMINLENQNPNIGSGMIGELKTAQKAKAFLQKLKSTMKAGCVKYTQIHPNSKIKTVALCGGSGVFLLPQAIAQGADIFISSDFKYHQFFDADNQIIIADIGHFESEQFTIELLHEFLLKKFRTFALFLTENRTNPVYYL